MSCDEILPLLDAYADEELGGRDALLVEDHLAACERCARALAARRALREAIANAGLAHALPETTEARLVGAVRQATRAQGGGRHAGWRALATAAAIVALLAVGFALGRLSRQREPATALADAAVSSHVRALLGGHAVDVPSTDQHTVKPWFTGKLDFAPEVIDLPSRGIRLVGGRLDDLGGRRVAALVYRAGAHQMSLFTWPDGSGGCDTPGVVERQRGFRVLAWSCDGMRYVVVSDAAEASLRALAEGIARAHDGAPL